MLIFLTHYYVCSIVYELQCTWCLMEQITDLLVDGPNYPHTLTLNYYGAHPPILQHI